MAITWTPIESNVDTVTKRADITFTRTDDAGETEVYSFKQAILGNQAQRDALESDVWDKHEEVKAKKVSVAAFIATVKATWKTNLEAREP